VNSSCELLLSSLDPASGSSHCCKVSAALREAAGTKGVTFRDVLLVSPEVCASLRKPASRIGGCACMGRFVVHCW
jgi:hypothetical protein